MKRIKSLLASFVAAILSVALLVPLAACDPEGDVDGANSIYVTSAGGMALQNVAVEVFNGNSSLGKKETNEEGKVSYNLDGGIEYTVTLSGVPAGFETLGAYTVKGSDKDSYIRLNSRVIETGSPTKTYAVGDVLYDFEQTYYYYDGETIQQKRVKISDVLKEKKAVLINFFYADCYWCNQEYPSLKSAYLDYQDKLEILAINDYASETESNVTTLVQNDKVPYLMCKDSANVGRWFEKSGWPTSFIIDRYGILCDFTTTQLEKSYWTSLFAKYTADDYSQNITQGGNSSNVFVPDKPEDFNVSMAPTQTISEKINNTGKPIVFTEDTTSTSDGGKYFWPWDLTEDQSAIYPTNSGHRGTLAAIYAQITLSANEVFAFDYKLSSLENNDYFYVSIDSRLSTGRQITMESGVKDWRTGFAYVSLEAGQHEICFLYYKSTTITTLDLEDKAYIKNIRIMSVADMNSELSARNETLEIPYFATREYDSTTKQFSIIENVYVADDGYYHLGTAATAKESDPYLLLDITHSTPFFGSNADNLYNLYANYKNQNGGLIINGVDYSKDIESYQSYSGNSTYKGLIPVTESIKNVLTKLYNNEIPSSAPFYDRSGRGWMQFCVAYRQYGVQQKLTDPIKGLSYFSAFETTESLPSDPTYVEVAKGTGQFIFEDGKYIDVEGSTRESEGNYNLTEYVNKVHFDRIIMPLGYIYKFVPEKTGVYNIHGIDCYYLNETAGDEIIVDGEDTDADLYDGSLNVSHTIAKPLISSDSDRIFRNEETPSFKILYHFEAGKTYYVSVNFRVVETTGDFAFRADYLGENYEYLHQATSDFYIPDENFKLHLNTYVRPVYDAENDVWRDPVHGGIVYVDFTEYTVLINRYTIEDILDENKKTAQYTFDLTKDLEYPSKDENGNDITVTIHFDLNEIFKDEDGNVNIPDALKGLENKIQDYTEIMRNYLERSKAGVTIGDTTYYGLMPVNNELYGILQLFNAKFMGYEDDTEWLKACWYVERLGFDA